jgi:hypothetical protein
MKLSLRRLALALGATLAVTASAAATTGTTALAYQSPQGGWFAGEWWCNVSGSCHHSYSDPINLIFYKPDGGAMGTLINVLNTAAPGRWQQNTCYNTSVSFYAGATPNPNVTMYRSPDGSYATDVSQGANQWWYTGCGPSSGDRNHFRYWSDDDKTVFIAVSMEYHGCWPSIHCISPNGFDNGRVDLSNDIGNGLFYGGWSYSWSNLYPYSSGSLQGVSYSGEVEVWTVTGASSPPPSQPAFYGVTGPGCGQDANMGVHVHNQVAGDWMTYSEGQDKGDGCGLGPYLWTHSNGSQPSGDTIQWYFHTGLEEGRPTCTVYVFIPATSVNISTAHPAHYHVYTNGSGHIADFTIDQYNVSGWQRAGAWTVIGGTISVIIDDQGPVGYGVAADALAVSCT